MSAYPMRWHYRYVALQDGTGGSVRHEVYGLDPITGERRRLICVAPDEEKAHLIAAAPRLLAELQSFVDRWGKYPKKPTGDDLQIYLENAQAAIDAAMRGSGGR